MRTVWLTASLLVVMAAAGSTSLQAAVDRSQDTQDVLRIEHEWCDAYRRGDTAYLENLMTPDFTLVSSGGTVNTAASELAELTSGEVKYSVFENRDMKVRFYGDTAVVLGRTKVEGTSKGEAFAVDVAFTDVLVRIDGKWRAVAGHASGKKA